MALSREVSVAVAGGAAALVYATFAAHMPAVVDVRASQPGDDVVSGTLKAAAWSSTAIVVGVALITKDMTVFIAGGLTTILLTWMYKHANAYDAGKGTALIPSSRALAALTAQG